MFFKSTNICNTNVYITLMILLKLVSFCTDCFMLHYNYAIYCVVCISLWYCDLISIIYHLISCQTSLTWFILISFSGCMVSVIYKKCLLCTLESSEEKPLCDFLGFVFECVLFSCQSG